MALIKCPECGKDISDKAKSCPNCGCPISEIINDGVIRIKMGSVKTKAISSKQGINVTLADGTSLWHGYVGQIAEFKLESEAGIVIKYEITPLHYGGTWSGKIDPSKGRKYQIIARQGFMKTLLELSPVEVFDAD